MDSVYRQPAAARFKECSKILPADEVSRLDGYGLCDIEER